MPIVQQIEEFLEGSEDVPCVDVRSPAEYEHGHIPGALNMPIFDNEERHRVGLCYAEEGQVSAVKLGLEIVGPRLRSMVEWCEQRSSSRTIRVYCWRGGMRSGSVAWLLESAGFRVRTLKKGYKAWRRFALDLFEKPHPLIVLGGNTGAGKTKILQHLQQDGEAMIDLEALAGHKGSAFGWLGEPWQATQEQFENALAFQLHQHRGAHRIWVEDESRRIGRINLPLGFWNYFLQAPLVYLDMARDLRVMNLVEDYGQFSPSEHLDALLRIKPKLGPERFSKAESALTNGQLEIVADICLEYYDVYYKRGLQLRDPARIQDCPTTTRDTLANARNVRLATALAGA